jgi:hypothetical protein
LQKKVYQEDYSHVLKTPERRREIQNVGGLSRILYTTLSKYQWVQPVLKAFYFALTFGEPEEFEYPHGVECTIRSDSGYELRIDLINL